MDETTRIPNRDGEFASLLDLFLTINPEIYTVTVNSPVGSSDYKLLSTSSILPISDREAPKPRTTSLLGRTHGIFCFGSEDPSNCAKEVSDVILKGMDAYIPFSKTCISNGKPWFDRKCNACPEQMQRNYRRNQGGTQSMN